MLLLTILYILLPTNIYSQIYVSEKTIFHVSNDTEIYVNKVEDSLINSHTVSNIIKISSDSDTVNLSENKTLRKKSSDSIIQKDTENFEKNNVVNKILYCIKSKEQIKNYDYRVLNSISSNFFYKSKINIRLVDIKINQHLNLQLNKKISDLNIFINQEIYFNNVNKRGPPVDLYNLINT